MSYENPELRQKVIVSAHRALLGPITEHLRAVVVDFNKKRLTMYAYFDLGSLEEEHELLDAALTEMAADLWQEIEEWYFEASIVPFPTEFDAKQLTLFLRYEKMGTSKH
jgi:hypothetical protein